MTFTPKQFKYSNIDDTKLQRFPSVEAGPQFLIIENATYDPETEVFDVMFRSLSNEAKFRIRSFMLGKDGKPNYMSVHWHNMLGYACCGIKTALDPTDLIGCVVQATVGLEPSWKDKKQYQADMETKGESDVPLYPQINADTFEPIPEDMMAFSERQDQFYVPNE